VATLWHGVQGGLGGVGVQDVRPAKQETNHKGLEEHKEGARLTSISLVFVVLFVVSSQTRAAGEGSPPSMSQPAQALLGSITVTTDATGKAVPVGQFITATDPFNDTSAFSNAEKVVA
jgi:hypothetical protein